MVDMTTGYWCYGELFERSDGPDDQKLKSLEWAINSKEIPPVDITGGMLLVTYVTSGVAGFSFLDI